MLLFINTNLIPFQERIMDYDILKDSPSPFVVSIVYYWQVQAMVLILGWKIESYYPSRL